MQGLKEIVKTNGIKESAQKVIDLINSNELKKVSLRVIWESFVGETGSTLSDGVPFNQSYIGKSERVQESELRLTAFSNIVGQLLAREIIQAYTLTPHIGDELVNVYETRLKNERVAGFTSISNDIKEIEEGHEYPQTGFNDKYVGTGEAKKKGVVIDVTQEAIYYDQTGQLLERCRAIGEKLQEQREIEILNGVLGKINIYYPSDVATALYSGSPQLVTTNALTDWRNIEKAELNGFDAMLNESGEKIVVIPKIIVVPLALKRTAINILKATNIYDGNFTAIGAKTEYSNPYGGSSLTILSSPLISTVTGDSTTWFIGDFKKQFRWKQVWPVQVFRQSGDVNQMSFRRDIVESFKVRYSGNLFALDNKYVVKNTA